MRYLLTLSTKALAPPIRSWASRRVPPVAVIFTATARRYCAQQAPRRDFTITPDNDRQPLHHSSAGRQQEAEQEQDQEEEEEDDSTMEAGKGKPEGKQEGKSEGSGKLSLKVPKGTRDWVGADIMLRERIFKAAGDTFQRHGGTPLDTPDFELKHILAGKYGEDSRLIYDLADQGGESCALRYDLTVPFARWLAMNNVQQIKRYQIAKVHRRDQPAIARGRLREFYQCDFDIAGEYDAMIPDAEVLRIVVEVFETLGLAKDVTIKINHRKILDGLFAVAGVPEDKIRSISSAVDKLDKMPWEEVKKEMVEEKGLAPEIADEIGEYTKYSGGAEIIDFLKTSPKMAANEKVKQGLNDMELLFGYLDAFQVTDRVLFDLSLARGLDYYTGLIYEAVIELPAERQDKSGETRIGSIAAGGRYDNLVGMYGKRQIPCVGISFGVDRIFTILKARHEEEKRKVRGADVFIMAFGGKRGLLLERMSVARTLWDAGIKAEFSAKVKPRLPAQFKAAEAGNIPLAVILGEDELAAGKVRVKVLGLADDHPEKEGRLVPREDVAIEVKRLLSTDLDDLTAGVKKVELANGQ